MKQLLLRAGVGLIFLMLVLATALFLAAGTLQFWQAWAYLAVFLACTLFITWYLARYDPELLSRRVQAGPVAEHHISQQIIQSLAGCCFIGMFVVSGLDARFHWSAVPSVLNIVADCMVVLGFAIVFLVFRENSYTSAIIEVAQEQRVISSGPYAVIRHPMYTGASLLLIFSPLALGSWVALLLSILLILVIVARLLDEERYLSTNLRGYDTYQQKVRYRLVPLIW